MKKYRLINPQTTLLSAMVFTAIAVDIQAVLFIYVNNPDSPYSKEE